MKAAFLLMVSPRVRYRTGGHKISLSILDLRTRQISKVVRPSSWYPRSMKPQMWTTQASSCSIKPLAKVIYQRD